jgi:hypothetical protein
VRAAHVILLVIAVGCAGAPKPGRNVPALPGPAHTFEEDVSARAPHRAPPEWVYWPDRTTRRRPGSRCFTGIGLPARTGNAALAGARQDARRQIARCVLAAAAGNGRPLPVGHEAVTADVLGGAIPLAVLDEYRIAGTMVRDLARQHVHVAYVLVELSPERAAQIVRAARSKAAAEVQRLLRERDALPSKRLGLDDRKRLDCLQRLQQTLTGVTIEKLPPSGD